MIYRVRLTAKTEQDIEAVLAWFSDQSATAAAERWLVQLMAKIATLETLPMRCALAAESEEIGLEIRELLFGKRRGTYRILFQIREQTVHIVRLWHSSRDAFSLEDL